MLHVWGRFATEPWLKIGWCPGPLSMIDHIYYAPIDEISCFALAIYRMTMFFVDTLLFVVAALLLARRCCDYDDDDMIMT